ncbi:MAG TPA: hypothetical protein PLA50_10870 [Bacteroidia bacterium]|nr:hypothetical protein [Bacteroidia bacterium]
MSKTNPFSDAFAGFGKMGGDAGGGAFGSGFSKPGEPAVTSPESKADDSGFPAAAFTGNPFESSGSFSTLFSKTAKEDEAIPFPTPATEAQPSAAASESEGVWGALFSGTALSEEEETEAGRPEADKADHAGFESIGNLLKQGAPPAAPETVAKPEAIEANADPFASPFDHAGAFAAGFSAFSPASAEAPKKGAEFRAAEEILQPAMPAAPEAKATEPAPTDISAPTEPMNTSFTAPVAEPRPAASPVAETAPFAMPAGFGEPTAKAETPAEPVKETVAESAPASAWPTTPESEAAPASAVEAAAPSAPAADDDLRDLELRAIFSTSESFTLSKVARKVVALSGINSCSLSTPVKLVQASRREENRLGDESREMVSTLRSLAKLTGMTEARTFTLQTDRGIVSLFLEGECCVTVHHDATAFGPGVREKLILIARSIGKLRE